MHYNVSINSSKNGKTKHWVYCNSITKLPTAADIIHDQRETGSCKQGDIINKVLKEDSVQPF